MIYFMQVGTNNATIKYKQNRLFTDYVYQINNEDYKKKSLNLVY